MEIKVVEVNDQFFFGKNIPPLPLIDLFDFSSYFFPLLLYREIFLSFLNHSEAIAKSLVHALNEEES